MGSHSKTSLVKARLFKKRKRRDKLRKELKNVAKILSKYKCMDKKEPEGSSDEANNVQQAPTSITHFAQEREKAFQRLKTIINDNLNMSSFINLSSCQMDTLCLQLEQNAILSSIQTEKYLLYINKLIDIVEESSAEKKLDKSVLGQVRKIWPDLLVKNIKQEKVTKSVNNLDVEVSKVPTPSVNTSSIANNTQPPTAAIRPTAPSTTCLDSKLPQPVPIKKTNQPSPSVVNTCPLSSPLSVAPSPTEQRGAQTLDVQPTIVSLSSIACKNVASLLVKPSTKEESLAKPPPIASVGLKPVSRVPPQAKEAVQPAQKEVSHPLAPDIHNGKNSVNNVSNDDFEIQALMQILEASDEETPKKEERQTKFVVNNEKPVCHNLAGALHPKIWSLERYMFMYKLMTRTARMTAGRYTNTRIKLQQLFGDDSDHEHEHEFMDYDRFIDCAVRRILPTTAKYVLPYYKRRRICGGSFIYKSLVRRIAESLVDEIDYPTEKDIRKYVDRFFPKNQIYVNVNDVWCFALDQYH